MVFQELEFLTESSVITPEQMVSVISLLPEQTSLSVSTSEPPHLSPISRAALQPSPIVPAPAQPVPVQVAAAAPPFPSSSPQPMSTPMDEKRQSPYPTPQPAPPPAYSYAAPLAYATALYAYNAADPGDLALLPNDRVAILEYTNVDWWKGRSMRTGLEGIFPAKYVRPDDGAAPQPMQPPAPPNYGNMPLQVSQAGPAPPPSAPATPGRLEASGKRFGKKLGDAAIFGAVSRPKSCADVLTQSTDSRSRVQQSVPASCIRFSK